MFGDPHFFTFDGLGYSFNGKGEYTLVMSESRQLTVQGRTEPVILSNGEFESSLDSASKKVAKHDMSTLLNGDALKPLFHMKSH